MSTLSSFIPSNAGTTNPGEDVMVSNETPDSSPDCVPLDGTAEQFIQGFEANLRLCGSTTSEITQSRGVLSLSDNIPDILSDSAAVTPSTHQARLQDSPHSVTAMTANATQPTRHIKSLTKKASLEDSASDLHSSVSHPMLERYV